MNTSMSSRTTVRDKFRAIAAGLSCSFGSPGALAIAILAVLVWAGTGHYFGFSDAWQLVINNGTTIITFLMAFLIQATQYRESRALQLKIDELLRAVHGARTGFVNVEDMSDAELGKLANELREAGHAAKIVSLVTRRASHSLAPGHGDNTGRAENGRRRNRGRRNQAGNK